MIDAAAEFCDQTGLVISVDKTKVVVFCSCVPGPFEWHCGVAPLHWVQQFEYLGALFDGTHGINVTFGKLHRNM